MNNKEKECVPPYMFPKYYYEKLDKEIVKQLSNEAIHRLINDLQEELKKRGEKLKKITELNTAI